MEGYRLLRPGTQGENARYLPILRFEVYSLRKRCKERNYESLFRNFFFICNGGGLKKLLLDPSTFTKQERK